MYIKTLNSIKTIKTLSNGYIYNSMTSQVFIDLLKLYISMDKNSNNIAEIVFDNPSFEISSFDLLELSYFYQ